MIGGNEPAAPPDPALDLRRSSTIEQDSRPENREGIKPHMKSDRYVDRRAFLGAFPAIAGVLGSASWAIANDPLTTTVNDLIKASGAADVAVAYYDLATGAELLIHPDATFHAASTMKVPVLMEVFRQAEAKRLSLDDRIAVKIDFASIVDGSPFRLKVEDDSEATLYRRIGERLTVRELARLMITESSNVATNLLVEKVTAAKTAELMDQLGARDVRVLRGVEDTPAYRRGLNNTTTARGLMLILTRLAERQVVSPAASDAMIAILRAQKFNEGIPAGMPAGVAVAHKTGWLTGIYHDAGIVEPPGNKPYVLVVLTRGIAETARAHKLVADISRAVHAAARPPARLSR